MSRKEASFRQLIEYMDRGESETAFGHNFYNNPYGRREDIIREFERNSGHLRHRKNGNALYHEVISLEAGANLERDRVREALAEIGREYIYRRAPEQLALGVIHADGPHVHLHICISANAVGKSERVRLSRSDFGEVQKRVEEIVVARWPTLGQGRLYTRSTNRTSERLKSTAAEQEMRSRRGQISRKEAIKTRLHAAFERAVSPEELVAFLRTEKLELYQRGNTVGVIDRETDRRHRLSTLGVSPHYTQTVARLLETGSTKQREQPGKNREPRDEPREWAPGRDRENATQEPRRDGARAGEREREQEAGERREPDQERRASDEVIQRSPDAAMERDSELEQQERRRDELRSIFRDREDPDLER